MKRILIILMCTLLISGCEFIEEVKTEEVVEEKEVKKEIVEKIEDTIKKNEEIVEKIEEIVEKKDEIEKLHWNHMPITYFIENKEECGDYETRKIRRAFDNVENASNGVVNFKEIEEPANIDVTCSFIEDCYEYKVDVRREEGIIYRYETICEHAKGTAQIIGVRGNEILKAKIVLVGLAGFAETTGSGASGFYIGSCGHPTTEIHEILHTFGYNHFADPESIMYYAEDIVGYTLQEAGSCVGSKKNIDEIIIEDLIDTYSRLG
ncbi:hypothetical protein KY342_00815 [Candidatus Woesearchaeota archaeon]|nr:hypothetical protein [Candidatus Woesearchaeota archaeon]